MVSSIKKGDKLEDQFYEYLIAQQERGDFVYGTHAPELCKIYKKKKYYCGQRKNDVEFDVVIEIYRQGALIPQFYVIFECKNHSRAIQEEKVTDFSHKLQRLFAHAAKGVLVISSRLQSGAQNIAKSEKMGIVKFTAQGLDVIAERKGGMPLEKGLIAAQIFKGEQTAKALKFSAYYNNHFFGSVDQLLLALDTEHENGTSYSNKHTSNSISFISDRDIQHAADIVLEQINYQEGPVDLEHICSSLSIKLHFSNQIEHDEEGNSVLGSANFDLKTISINAHENKHRERFTIAHEIGHFCMRHDRYLRSENIAEQDLLINGDCKRSFSYESLEYQANIFASYLLLPHDLFNFKVALFRESLGIKNTSHGYIYVDNQTCNFTLYNELLTRLSLHFEVSKLAIEVRFKKLGMLNDKRRQINNLSISHILANVRSYN